MSATPRKPRPAISEMFNPPTDNAIPPVPKLSATKNIASNTPDKTSKSSAALRDQIRKAKAARKSDVASTQGSKTVASGYSTDAQSDPFNQLPKLGTSLLKRRIDMARTDGRLNLIAMGLQEFPPEVLKMYDFEANADSSVPWGEAVDLTRFNVADNDLKAIPDELFPDVDMANVDNNEEVDLPQFGGIEVLDLHGNLLRTLPMGLRRLERLTSLNLTRNNLDDNVFEVISQIKPLRDLKLSECSLSGTLPESIGQLHALKTLDLSGNKLTALPDSMQSLTHLRILDVSQNKLTSLSLSILQSCPLRDLLATKNSLAGTLFPPSVPGHPRLERLVVSCNSLTSLTPLPTLALPSLATLDFSVNRITALPDLAACPQLTALLAEDNKLTELPRGFTALARLKSADFTGNDLRVIDEEVGLMEALVSLRVAANPLRDRKFLTMGAEEIKKDLRGRLAPDLNF
ncbi:L domain-like protein [Eremomyces bilateralis CBS 781.70]|uniref:L domain-like protein n=1 Tax=Eremomyces bilateralis CBS 781.70 TaxID=1392243 RepID=A0A6G1G9Q9_9PEZI|nr:L domain-like protein [Eremomyces bilateralis CBS 781.70]KAF1814763.1 L domain-like protein [Eremomyces bilateralis CBS 781.70]